MVTMMSSVAPTPPPRQSFRGGGGALPNCVPEPLPGRGARSTASARAPAGASTGGGRDERESCGPRRGRGQWGALPRFVDGSGIDGGSRKRGPRPSSAPEEQGSFKLHAP